MKKLIFATLIAMMLAVSASSAFASRPSEATKLIKPNTEWIIFPICFPKGEDIWICIPSA